MCRVCDSHDGGPTPEDLATHDFLRTLSRVMGPIVRADPQRFPHHVVINALLSQVASIIDGAPAGQRAPLLQACVQFFTAEQVH